MAQVLLAAGNPKAQSAFAALLEDLGCTPIVRAASGKEALRVLQEESFSLVLIVTPLADGSGTEAAVRAAQTTAGVIFVCTPEGYGAACARLQESGVFVFSADMGRRLFENAVRLMTAVHIRLAGALPQAERMQQKLQDIRVIDKAKCLLIQYSGLTEEEAHRYVEKQAMDQRVSKRGLAEIIIKTYE